MSNILNIYSELVCQNLNLHLHKIGISLDIFYTTSFFGKVVLRQFRIVLGIDPNRAILTSRIVREGFDRVRSDE